MQALPIEKLLEAIGDARLVGVRGISKERGPEAALGEEPGALEQVAGLAASWCQRYL